MPARNPRINVVLDEPVYRSVKRLAKRDRVSLSLKARDLIREALELEEDLALARFAEMREKTFERGSALTPSDLW